MQGAFFPSPCQVCRTSIVVPSFWRTALDTGFMVLGMACGNPAVHGCFFFDFSAPFTYALWIEPDNTKPSLKMWVWHLYPRRKNILLQTISVTICSSGLQALAGSNTLCQYHPRPSGNFRIKFCSQKHHLHRFCNLLKGQKAGLSVSGTKSALSHLWPPPSLKIPHGQCILVHQ